MQRYQSPHVHSVRVRGWMRSPRSGLSSVYLHVHASPSASRKARSVYGREHWEAIEDTAILGILEEERRIVGGTGRIYAHAGAIWALRRGRTGLDAFRHFIHGFWRRLRRW